MILTLVFFSYAYEQEERAGVVLVRLQEFVLQVDHDLGHVLPHV